MASVPTQISDMIQLNDSTNYFTFYSIHLNMVLLMCNSKTHFATSRYIFKSKGLDKDNDPLDKCDASWWEEPKHQTKWGNRVDHILASLTQSVSNHPTTITSRWRKWMRCIRSGGNEVEEGGETKAGRKDEGG